MKCDICNLPKSPNGHKALRLCAKHLRIYSMYHSSKTRRKITPKRRDIELMIDALGDGMPCPSCKRNMVLHTSLGNRASLITLQHWPDGRITLLCQSCNTRHGYMRNADIRFAECGNEKKSCSDCKSILPLDDFYVGKRFGGRDGRCKTCAKVHAAKYRKAV